MRDLEAELASLQTSDSLRHRQVVDAHAGSSTTIGGREFLSFSSNDYLGLAGDARVVAALCDGARQYGAGAGASHLVSGHLRVHDELERRLAEFAGMPRALLFSSGYLANLAAVTTLADRSTEIFADRLNHASLNDAMRLTRSRFHRYPHCDLVALERALEGTNADKLVITDAVFSMDGDVAPLDRILALCERYDARLLVDDAHGFGVLGPGGRGSLAHFALASPRIVYMGTLGKAAGVSGAFVAASAQLIELMIQRARPYIYTTAGPPALALALIRSLELIETESWRRERLAQLSRRLAGRLSPRRWRFVPSPTAIQPLIVGTNHEALAVSEALADCGVLVPAIRPPTVPEGTARLRISLSAAHQEADIDQLVAALIRAEEIVA